MAATASSHLSCLFLPRRPHPGSHPPRISNFRYPTFNTKTRLRPPNPRLSIRSDATPNPEAAVAADGKDKGKTGEPSPHLPAPEDVVLRAYLTEGLDSATKYLRARRQEGWPTGSAFFSLLEFLSSQGSQVAEAEQVWGLMKEFDANYQLSTFHDRIRSRISNGELDQLPVLVLEMKLADIDAQAFRVLFLSSIWDGSRFVPAETVVRVTDALVACGKLETARDLLRIALSQEEYRDSLDVLTKTEERVDKLRKKRHE